MQKFVLSPALFQQVCALLAGAAGLHFDDSKLQTLQLHMRDRARSQHCASLEDYYRLLTAPDTGRDELRKLIEIVTIHETSFFRNHEHFRALREIVLPTLARLNATSRRLRIWSAGCATGEEAYSLAITCLEQPELAGWQIVIEATDLSERVLAYARRGKFRSDALRYMEPDRIARWFVRQTQEAPPPGSRRATGPIDPIYGLHEVYAVGEKVRSLVRFQGLNLAKPPYPEGFTAFDLIVCENVIIYLQPEVTREIVQQFYDRLQPGGYLFLGYSETLWQISNRFQLITCPNTFFYRRRLQEAAAAPPARPPAARPAPPKPAEPDRTARRSALPAVPTALPRPSDPTAAPRSPSAAPAGTSRPAARDPGSVRLAEVAPALGSGEIDPAVALALAAQLVRQAREHLEAGRYAEAQDAFLGALARNSSSVDALIGLAQIHANQGRLRQARAECARALQIDALCEEAHLLSALIARLAGELNEAIDHFEKVLYINFESITGHYHLAELYRAQKRFLEAVREYRRTLWALGRHREDIMIDGLPASMIRQACEQQIRRLAPPA